MAKKKKRTNAQESFATEEGAKKKPRSAAKRNETRPARQSRRKTMADRPTRDEQAAPYRGSDQGSDTAKPSEAFPIVALGASAGGLAALKQFFACIPNDSGLAYVVVVHLSPEHKSHLAELLQPHVQMPVEQVSKTVPLERNRVYVIPPNSNLDTIDTHLRLTELERRREQRAPIDHFFRTLAKTHDGNAISIILTGTGSDGTLGLREIKEHGGITIVQDPNDAEYDGMPQSAIATGLVDLVLPLSEIPDAVLRFARPQPNLPVSDDTEEVEGMTRRLLQKIFVQLRARTGRDFSRYKRSTILRRIQRRMQLRQIEEFSDYLELLRGQPEEVRTLADDLLITVTSFFRDPEVFQVLEKEVIPRLFREKTADDEVRVWSVGCATGEEAYSLAILLLEEAARWEIAPGLQVFASDLHEHSLKQAREGFYPGDIETDVSPERLKRFFVRENGGYRIRKDLREIVIFAPHNLLADPPFSRLDLIACRNLMIYIQRELQRDVVELFHYALRPEGFLVLGTSETVDATDLFQIEDKKRCIFRKRNVPVPEPRLPVFPMTPTRTQGEVERDVHTGEPLAYGMLHQRMVEQYALPSALVSPDDKLVHLSEHAGRYFVHPGGEPTTNLFKVVREELRIELRAMLHAARELGQPRRSKPIDVRFNGDTGTVVLQVRPAQEPARRGFVLVIFDECEPAKRTEKTAAPTKRASASASRKKKHARERELEAELEQTRQRLQAIIEEYETSQEEMKASNEEMQSTNEELRSTMEELETSKEELQSMNEELQTVNQENRHKVEELAQLSSDLQNLLAATDIATLFLDRELRIVRFTPKVSELFNVRMTDRGRPISDLTHRLGYDQLQEDAKRVLDRLASIEREVGDDAGRCYLTRVMPYRSQADRIEGVVITCVDITARKEAETQIREAMRSAELILETLPEPLLVLTQELTVKTANGAFYECFHVGRAETEGRKIYDLGSGQWNIPSLRRLLEDVLPGDNVFHDYEVEHEFEGLGRRVMLLSGRRLDHRQLILLAMHDITERYSAECALRKSEERLQRMVNIEGVGVLIFNESGTLLGANDTMLALTGYSREEVENGKLTWRTMTPPEYIEATEQQMRQLEETGRIGPYEKEYLRKDGSRWWMVFAGASLGDGTFVEYCIDVSDRKRAEAALKDADRRKDEFLATLAHELRNPLAPICAGLQLMKMAEDKAATFEEVGSTIERQVRQLVTLVDDLLDVSRITRGTLELRKCKVKLADVIQSAVEESRPLLDESRHELIVAIPTEPIFLYADPHRLAQVLSNLLNNAAVYTPEGGQIRLEAEQRDGEFVVSVRDNGIGLPSDRLDTIFELFGQIDNPQKGSTSQGIGLTLVKSLVELHDGRVGAHSDGPGQGSTFTVRLPIDVDAVAAESSPIESVKTADSPLGRRVLIVDDNQAAAEMLSRVVKMLGHDIRTAGDGQQAIEVAAEFSPHLVLMDIGMPKMDGCEAARRIREQEWGQGMTLVALTGWGADNDKQKVKEAGFDEHLVKPIDTSDLQRVLARAAADEKAV